MPESAARMVRAYEEELVVPDVADPAVRFVVEQAILDHIQKALILLHPLMHPRASWDECSEREQAARTAYSAIHDAEKKVVPIWRVAPGVDRGE